MKEDKVLNETENSVTSSRERTVRVIYCFIRVVLLRFRTFPFQL